MIEQPCQPTQSTSTPQELKKQLLDSLSTEQQAIAELSNEELETIAGGVATLTAIDAGVNFARQNRLISAAASVGRHYKTAASVALSVTAVSAGIVLVASTQKN